MHEDKEDMVYADEKIGGEKYMRFMMIMLGSCQLIYIM